MTLRFGALGLMACVSSSGQKGVPTSAPTVSWTPVSYVAQSLDGPMTGISDAAMAKDIERLLAERHGQPFRVTWVSDETFSAPGWPGGFPGRFHAHPSADPSSFFGGDYGPTGLIADNYPCIRAAQPMVAWAQTAGGADQVFVAAHSCARSNQVAPAVSLHVFDATGRDPELVEADVKGQLEAWVGGTPHPLDRIDVELSIQPKGAGPVVRKVVTTSRRPEHARNEVTRWEVESRRFVHTTSGWGDTAVTPNQRAERIEEDVDVAIRPLAPGGVHFEVRRRGEPEDTVASIARRPTVRESVVVRVLVVGDPQAQALADWAVAAQAAIDSRLLLFFEVTVCDAALGEADPWSRPDLCAGGWDDYTVFVLDKPRTAPAFWPYPPARRD